MRKLVTICLGNLELTSFSYDCLSIYFLYFYATVRMVNETFSLCSAIPNHVKRKNTKEHKLTQHEKRGPRLNCTKRTQKKPRITRSNQSRLLWHLARKRMSIFLTAEPTWVSVHFTECSLLSQVCYNPQFSTDYAVLKICSSVLARNVCSCCL